MPNALVIRGRFAGRTFVPTDPLPFAEGAAELIIFPDASVPPTASIFDLVGKAPRLRSAEDIASQLRDERDAWGEP